MDHLTIVTTVRRVFGCAGEVLKMGVGIDYSNAPDPEELLILVQGLPRAAENVQVTLLSHAA